MISKKYLFRVQALLLSGIMSCVMSAIITFINLGLISGFFIAWLKAWGLAYIIAFPTISIIFPFVRRLATAIASKED